jgi:hypothetical protein
VPDRLNHLELQPLSRPVRERKKARGFPPRVVRYRSPSQHASDLARQADAVLEQLRVQARPEGVTPKQIVEVRASRRINEQRLASSGLVVLDSSEPERVVAVSRDQQMSTLRERLGRYGAAPDLPKRPSTMRPDEPDEGPSAPYEDVFDGIDGFERRTSSQRITPRLGEALHSGAANLNVIADLYSPEDPELREMWIEEVERLAERAGRGYETFDDPAIGVTLIRLDAGPELVQKLSQLDQVASLDTPAAPSLTAPALADLQDLESLAPEVTGPDPGAPALGIIDSGVASGHPFLTAATLGTDALHPAFNDDGEDQFGHGTLVAGLALYGDVLAFAQHGAFAAPFPLASVKVFDQNGEIPDGVNPAILLRDALEHLVDEYDCRVICLSLGDHNDPFLGGKASPLAALIDDLARALDVVVVVPTGNLEFDSLIAPARVFAHWPDYLVEPGNELLSPSQASLALTVGAIAARDATDLSGANVGVVASAGGPAPYARRGPGVRDAQKPELVADGGNWVYDRSDGAILDDTGTAVVSLSAADALFDTAIGSSFAAAQVAHIAGHVSRQNPDLSAAGVRALILQSALQIQPLPSVKPAEFQQLVGHGLPDRDRALWSSDERVVLISESTLRPDGFHVYRLPSGTDFFTASGQRSLTLALAFDPPVRYRRFDYLAYQMEAVVVRGVSEDEVFHLASSDNKGKLSELSKRHLGMKPTVTQNARGVNQLARVIYRQRPQQKFQDDWYIVVRSVNKWMRDRSPQPYALAVAIEVEGSVELYTQLRAEVQVRTRARARV